MQFSDTLIDGSIMMQAERQSLEEGDAEAVAEGLAVDLGLDANGRDLAAGLLRLGASVDQIRHAADHGRLEDAIFEQVLDPQREERTVSAREIEERGGLTVTETQTMMQAFGLPAPEAAEPFLTAEEGQAFVELGRISELWTAEIRTQVGRVYGQALTRIAQTEIDLFRSRVERHLREITPSSLDALAAVRQAFGLLLPLADPVLLGVHRRKIEQVLTQAAVWEVELEVEGLVPGSRLVSLLFCDLKDFTSYVDARGDAAAMEVLERFSETVEEHRGDRGRLVKALGDGFMLAYPEPREAVDAAVRIAAAMRDVEGIGFHAGIHHGMAVFREGDYFGRAPSVAARLLAAAEGGELLATADAAAGAPDRAWRKRGRRRLRGFADPVDVYALELPSAAVASTPSEGQ